jgi:hypothetical protein
MYMQPSLTTDCAELYAAAQKVAAERGIAIGGIDLQVNPVAAKIVGGMASATDGSRALAIGLKGDESAESIVRLYVRDNLPPV